MSYSLGGRNPVADLKQQLKVAPDCGGMPSLEGLLPLCLTSCSNFWLSEYKPLDVDSSLVISLSVGVVNALNFLFAGGNAEKPAATLAIGSLGVAHEKMLRHVFSSVSNFLAGTFPDFDLKSCSKNLLERKRGYGGEVVSVRRELVASRVIPVWPKVGEACVCDITDFIDEDLKAQMLNLAECLLPEAEWPSQTPHSKVHASDSEWFKICQAWSKLTLFEPIAEDEIFTNQFGDKVLMGGMGVDKVKEVGNEVFVFLRFICIMCPINAYLREIAGDAWSLPQASLLSCLILKGGELFWTDSEDLTSCFNLFKTPRSWRGFMTFSKKVSMAAFGGPSNIETFVAMRSVPMGWKLAVGLIQHFMRRFIFGTLGVPKELEVNKFSRPADGPAVVTCMDGFDFITKIKFVIAGIVGVGCDPTRGQANASPLILRFRQECQKRGLPINDAKSVVQSFAAAILGGQLDGISGRLSHSREKGLAFIGTTLSLLALEVVPQVAVQHWAGLFCFCVPLGGLCSRLRKKFLFSFALFPMTLHSESLCPLVSEAKW